MSKEIKIVIVGSPGSGMSTVSQALAGLLKMNGIPVEVKDLDGEAQLQFSSPQLFQNFSQLRDKGLKVCIEQQQAARVVPAAFKIDVDKLKGATV